MSRWVTRLARGDGFLFCFLILLVSAIGARAQDAIVLPGGTVGTPYSADAKAEGGLAPLTWRLSGGQLPLGLAVSAAGKIEGTPTAAGSQPSTFDLTVTDSSQPPQTAVQHFSIVIVIAPLHIVGGAAAQPKPSASGLNVPICGSGARPAGICGGSFLRTIVGFEQAGVSAAPSKQDFFFDLLYDRPLGFQPDTDLGPSLRSWGNLRISSVPQQINSGVAEFATDFAQKVGNVQVNQVAQSFEFLGGMQYRIFASGAGKDTKGNRTIESYAGPNTGVRHRISINLILGGGVVTPLTPQESTQIFNVPTNQPAFSLQYPQTVGKQFVAFTLEDRNRFFRQAYGGFRLMTHYIDSTSVRPPETFDLTYGFNESVTGGRIHGGVLRLEGFVPIPYSATSWIYLFGTGIFRPGGHAVNSTPFLLNPAPTGTLPTDPGAVVIPTPQTDRDYYRVGIGIDFVDLVKKISDLNAANKAKQAAASKASQAVDKTGQGAANPSPAN
jgi:putative Ig domain-containing protein